MREILQNINKKDATILSAFSASQLTDIASTLYATSVGVPELNPLIKDLLASDQGEIKFALVKLAAIMFVSGLYLLSKKNNENFYKNKIGLKNATIAGSFFYFALSINNIASTIIPPAT